MNEEDSRFRERGFIYGLGEKEPLPRKEMMRMRNSRRSRTNDEFERVWQSFSNFETQRVEQFERDSKFQEERVLGTSGFVSSVPRSNILWSFWDGWEDKQ